eukprot:1020533-Prymnesium_polylepis.1
MWDAARRGRWPGATAHPGDWARRCLSMTMSIGAGSLDRTVCARPVAYEPDGYTTYRTINRTTYDAARFYGLYPSPSRTEPRTRKEPNAQRQWNPRRASSQPSYSCNRSTGYGLFGERSMRAL